jgi:hypothetical protein
MTDVMLDAHPRHATRWSARSMPDDDMDARLTARRREFRAYFALLLVLELPAALVVWSLRALRHGAWPAQGPIRAARSRAALVASLILSA